MLVNIIVDKIFQSLDKNINVLIINILLNYNYQNFVEKIVNIYVIWIKILNILRNIDQRTIFIRTIDFFLVDKFLRFWRLKNFLLFLLSLYLSNLLNQLSKHLRYNNLNNNDYRCLNEKIYIENHNDEIRIKFYWFVVNNFFRRKFLAYLSNWNSII